MSPPFSVVIPAYNESAVIERCLNCILAGAPTNEPDIIVVCNGCTDDTAQRARRFGERVRVIELTTGSKPLALNTGNAAATEAIRIFVDADLIVDYRTLIAIAAALDTEAARVASPPLTYDDSASTRLVQLYYKLWRELPYAKDRRIGGIVGLNTSGLERVGTWPDVTADDLYVNRLFAQDEKLQVDVSDDGAPVLAKAIEPKNLATLLHIEARRHLGAQELNTFMQERDSRLRTAQIRALRRLMSMPRFWPALTVYVGVKVAVRLITVFEPATGERRQWRRDHTSRVNKPEATCSHQAD